MKNRNEMAQRGVRKWENPEMRRGGYTAARVERAAPPSCVGRQGPEGKGAIVAVDPFSNTFQNSSQDPALGLEAP